LTVSCFGIVGALGLRFALAEPGSAQTIRRALTVAIGTTMRAGRDSLQ
jgi:hypothetical protein